MTLGDAEDALQRKAVLYDKAGDQHYDYISAWIKSTRGSDPDASLYYLAAMVEGGEDPRFIARRMIVLASEDIGNADPQALPIAVAAAHAVEHVGLPGGGVRARPGGDLPVAGAEVGRRQARAGRGPRPHPRARRQAAAGGAAVGGLPGGAQARARQGLRLPARRTRATSTTRSTCPRALEGLRFYFPDEGEPEAPAAARRRSARRAAGRRAPGGRPERPRWPPQPLRSPCWSLVPAAGRARYLRRAATAILDELDPLADALADTVGQPRTEGVLARAAAVGRRPARPRRRRPEGAARPAARPDPAAARRAPLAASRRRSGSVGVRGGRASPWAEPVLETGAALLAGNAVVLSTPLRRAHPRAPSSAAACRPS